MQGGPGERNMTALATVQREEYPTDPRPGSRAASHQPTGAPMGTNLDVVKGIYAAFSTGDVPAVLGAFDPQISWLEAENFLLDDQNPYVGPMTVATGVFQRLVERVDNFSVTPERFTDGGDTIVAEGRYRGTMKATGVAADTQFAHVWRLRNGLVTGFQQYVDTKQWADAASGGTALTRTELIKSLQNEVRILLHLISKVDRAQLDYRPTPKQRSTRELIGYLSFMGPEVVRAIRAGAFDADAWTAAEKAAESRDFDQTVEAIEAQSEEFARVLGGMTDTDLRAEVEVFGQAGTGGSHIVNLVLSGYAAYRTQLFCYLKACGQASLSTWDLWAGMDEPEPKAG